MSLQYREEAEESHKIHAACSVLCGPPAETQAPGFPFPLVPGHPSPFLQSSKGKLKPRTGSKNQGPRWTLTNSSIVLLSCLFVT